MSKHWRDTSDETFCVRAEFAGGTVSYTTIAHAADVLGFIDREAGVQAIQTGKTLRSHIGTEYTIVGIPVEAEPGSVAGRVLGL